MCLRSLNGDFSGEVLADMPASIVHPTLPAAPLCPPGSPGAWNSMASHIGNSTWMPTPTVKAGPYRESQLESLGNPDEAPHYLNACLEDEDARVFLLALRDVADARGGLERLRFSPGRSVNHAPAREAQNRVRPQIRSKGMKVSDASTAAEFAALGATWRFSTSPVPNSGPASRAIP
jgi:hypothetical protein